MDLLVDDGREFGQPAAATRAELEVMLGHFAGFRVGRLCGRGDLLVTRLLGEFADFAAHLNEAGFLERLGVIANEVV